MNDVAVSKIRRPDLSDAYIRRRYAAERRFRYYGIFAVGLAIAMLGVLLISVCGKGYSAFFRTEIALDVLLDPTIIMPEGKQDRDTLINADYQSLIKEALRTTFPDVTSRNERKLLYALVSNGAGNLIPESVLNNPSIVGGTQRFWFVASDEIDMLQKNFIRRDVSEADRVVSDQQISWFDALDSANQVRTVFNVTFLSSGDSREPEQAGILGALMGSAFTILVTILLALPLGVMSAIYLEEFAPRNRLTEIIEVNINNLAAVPSIVFGLLGLAVLLGVLGLPRSAPMVGGIVLALMTLPTIIIATRAALKAVPPSIREAAYGIGASPLQVVMHHVLPLATPGIMTGAIIGLARALGESAPLLMIGMVAFIVDVPQGPTDPSTVLPVQIYLWADSPERAFVEKTSAGIMVLLAFLIAMNGIAIFVRRRFERRW